MDNFFREIDINKISSFEIGNAEDREACTGVSVILCKEGACAGVDISGGGPASRETSLVSNLTNESKVHGVVLSGGSSFGLAASDEVLKYLEEKKIGFDTGYTHVPLVMQSSLYDLCVGRADVRPDGKMAYKACVDAESRNGKSGILGAGTGATVGKMCGLERAMQSGIGVAAIEIGELQIGAIVAVNALGDVFDFENGKKIAGLLNENRTAFADTVEELAKLQTGINLFTGNTTIGCIITNGKLSRDECKKVASQARNGYARAINPIGTTADGDSIYAMASGQVDANVDVVGTMSARVMAMAIRNAVAESIEKIGFEKLDEALPLK